jgi:hypothetical protein
LNFCGSVSPLLHQEPRNGDRQDLWRGKDYLGEIESKMSEDGFVGTAQ